jgi:hypothetical protein
MKKNILIIICFIAVGLLVFSCTKNELRLTEYELPSGKAYVRFAFYSPATATSSVIVKVNDVKVNGATTSITAGLYPSVINTPDYASISPTGNIKLSIPNIGTSNDSIVVFTGTLALEAGKFYAFTLADSGSRRTAFAIPDNLGALPDSGFFNIRFINAMGNSPAFDLVRVDSTSSTVVVRDTIARGVSFKSASTFIKQPITPTNSFLRYRFVANGVSIGQATLPATAVNKRSITFYATGIFGGTGSFAPGVSSFIYNQ